MHRCARDARCNESSPRPATRVAINNLLHTFSAKCKTICEKIKNHHNFFFLKHQFSGNFEMLNTLNEVILNVRQEK